MQKMRPEPKNYSDLFNRLRLDKPVRKHHLVSFITKSSQYDSYWKLKNFKQELETMRFVEKLKAGKLRP